MRWTKTFPLSLHCNVMDGSNCWGRGQMRIRHLENVFGPTVRRVDVKITRQ